MPKNKDNWALFYDWSTVETALNPPENYRVQVILSLTSYSLEKIEKKQEKGIFMEIKVMYGIM